jgi:hypothetical protein
MKTVKDYREFYRLASINAQRDRDEIMAKVAEQFPLCKARNILSRFQVMAGRESRVNFSALLMSFNQAERARWDRDTRDYPRDDYGMLPEAVERFLQTLIDEGVSSSTTITQEADMATATAPKKKSAKKPARKAGATKKKAPAAKKAAAPSGGTVAASKNGDDPNQTYIPGTVDEPIPAMDRDLKSLQKTRSEQMALKDKESALLTSISRRMHDNKLNSYRGAGYSVAIVPSAESVKVKPAKDK